MEKNIYLNNKEYELVKIQRRADSAVYKNGDEYLRIGENAKIKKDLGLHKKMESFGFPVSRVVGEGSLGEQYYFIEKIF